MKSFDVVVVGAGPAGMSAAALTSRAGLSTLVLDEQVRPGGQIYRDVEASAATRRRILGPDYGTGAELTAALRASNAEYVTGAVVWNIDSDKRIDYSAGGRSYSVAASAIVVATGAIERPTPLPGWTLPGVTSVGAVQILLKTSGIVLENVVLTGSGPLLWLTATQLIAAGSPPKAVVETVPRSRSAGTRHRIETHHVALHQGVVPNQQMTRLLNCAHRFDTSQRAFVPVVDEHFETSVPQVFVAGDGAGIGGARSAALRGQLVAMRIAEKAGKPVSSERAACRAELQKDAAVRPLLEALYAPSQEVLAPQDTTMICRCEEITAGQIREAVALGAPGPNQVKSFLRSGMGPCQGRMCGLAVTEIIAAARGDEPSTVDYYRIRPPLKPLLLSELAGLDSGAPREAAE